MKNVLVTGATDGIGLETARQLLAQGLHVLVHGRSEDKASRNARTLAAAAGAGRITPVWGDLSSMRQVVDLAQQVQERAPALDVLVNNAGVFQRNRVLTEDGFEMTMAVNHFAVFLLTNRLLPALSAAPAGRVVTVSSIAHHGADLDLEDLTFAHGFEGYDVYAASKLANILFTRTLARRLAATPVTANALHPGVIDTKLLHAGFDIRGASLEQGARTSVYLAVSDRVPGVSGKYFVDSRETTPSRQARDDRLADGLWAESVRLLRDFL